MQTTQELITEIDEHLDRVREYMLSLEHHVPFNVFQDMYSAQGVLKYLGDRIKEGVCDANL